MWVKSPTWLAPATPASAELLHARGFKVVHLLGPGRSAPHRQWELADVRDGRLYLCRQLVA